MSTTEIIKSYELNIDFLDYEKKRDITSNIVYSEGDVNTAFIDATLLLGGEIIDLEGCTVTASVKSGSDKQIKNFCDIVNAKEGKITIPFVTSSLSKIGFNKFEVAIYKNNKKIVSPMFNYRVVESATDNDSIEDSKEYDVLLVLISQVQEALKDMDTMASRVETLGKEVSTNEEVRKTNEVQRVSNEEVRVTNEAKRQKDFSEKIVEINDLTTNVTTQLDSKIKEVDTQLSTIVTTFDEKVEIIDEKISTLDKNVEDKVNAKVDSEMVEVKANIDTVLNDKTSEKFKEVDSILVQKLAENTSKVNDKINEASESITRVDNKIKEINVVITQNVDKVDAKISEVNIAKTELVNDVNATKENLSDSIDKKVVEFEERFNSLESANPIGEVIQSRVDTTGVTHESLAKRLQSDYDKKANKKDTYTKAEVDSKVDGITSVNDSAISTESTWSSSKIDSELDKKENAVDAQTKYEQAVKDAKGYTDTKISGLVNQAPELLDTLEELSSALGNDPNFATTIANQIGQKADKDKVYTKEEVDGMVVGGGSASIDDTTISKTSTWSSNKTSSELATKVGKVDGKDLSTNDFTNTAKTKLEGLENYVHPNNENTRHVSDAQITKWDNKSDGNHTHSQYSTTSHKHSYSELNDLPTIPSINDSGVSNSALWSSSKVSSEIAKISDEVSGNVSDTLFVTTNEWTATDGGYVVNVVHSLKTEKILIYVTNTDTKESVIVAKRVINNSTIELKDSEPSNLTILIINGGIPNTSVESGVDDSIVSKSHTWSSSKINGLTETITDDYIDGLFNNVGDDTEPKNYYTKGESDAKNKELELEIVDAKTTALSALAQLKKSDNLSFETSNSIKEFECVEDGYIDNIRIEGNTLVNLGGMYRINGTDPDKIIRTRLSPISDLFVDNNRVSNGTFTLINYTDKQINFVGVNNKNEWVVNGGDVAPKSSKLITLDAEHCLNGVDFSPNVGWSNADLTIYSPSMFAIIEGNHMNENIPYFKGIKSVGQGDNISVLSYGNDNKIDVSNVTYVEGYYIEDGGHQGSKHKCVEQFIEVAEGVQYLFENVAKATLYYDKDKNVVGYNLENSLCNALPPYHINNVHHSYYSEITIPKGVKFIRVSIGENSEGKFNIYKNTKYDLKHIKSTLRSLPNGVKDTIEKVGNRYVSKIKCGEYEVESNSSDTYFLVRGEVVQHNIELPFKINVGNKKFINNFFKQIDGGEIVEGLAIDFSVGKEKTLVLRINKNRLKTLDINGVKLWLKENPIKIVYELETPITKEILNFNPRTFSPKNTLVLNSGTMDSSVVQANASFEVTTTLASSIDALSGIVGEFNTHEHDYQRWNLTTTNGMTQDVKLLDINQLQDTGFYSCWGDNPNKPSFVMGSFFVRVTKFMPKYCLQEIYGFDGLSVGFRNMADGVWSSWNKISTTVPTKSFASSSSQSDEITALTNKVDNLTKMNEKLIELLVSKNAITTEELNNI